jgi:hypothetical protein
MVKLVVNEERGREREKRGEEERSYHHPSLPIFFT